MVTRANLFHLKLMFRFRLMFSLVVAATFFAIPPNLSNAGPSDEFCQDLLLPAKKAVAESALAPLSQSITASELTFALGENMGRVKEFDYIRRIADAEGIRVWLFGGSASAYAHYVKWDLKRLKGDIRYQPDRFGYDYSDIFRSNQDADIVIDGPAERLERAAVRIEAELKSKFDHLQGSKSVWEVRFLKKDRADKGAILGDYDFLNQHSDSNSTGLIEITKPPTGEPRLRDVRDWDSKAPAFLTDLLEDRLHFYYAANHFKTRRAKEGLNPEIFSVVRYLTKAFQYELQINGEDLRVIKEIIDRFDPRSIHSGYAAAWIEKNAKKLIQNGVNIEYAVNELDRLGLRQKLIQIKNDPSVIGSLAWWLSKHPLPSFPLGKGTGKTAKALGLDIVAHETNNFLAYESITRAHTGVPNVLSSRNGFTGEAAACGDGFYTQIGTKGARNTGFTIRFHLNPNAREGTDFTVSGTYVVIKNKNAIRVIPESLKVDPVYYFELLAGKRDIDASDKGLLEKLKRRVSTEIALLSPEEEEKILILVKENLGNERLLIEWFSLSTAKKHPNLLEKIDPKIDLSRILGNQKHDWIVTHKNLPEVRKKLLTLYPEVYRSVVNRILNQNDLDPGTAKRGIAQLKQSFMSQDILEVVAFQKILSNTELESWAEGVLWETYTGSLYGNSIELGRTLEKCLTSKEDSLKRFGRAILGQPLKPDSPYFNIVSAYREIIEFENSSHPEMDWLRLEGVDPEKKAAYLKTKIGSGPGKFTQYFTAVPEAQREMIRAALEKHSTLFVFLDLAERQKIDPEVFFHHAKAESLEFKPIITEAQAKSGGVTFMMGEGNSAKSVTLDEPFEIQATPFTQLQALLSTGKNQSHFVDGGIKTKVKGKMVKLNPNKPAEQYSWYDMRVIIDALNELDPKHQYRRATEAEWEYAARGGTSSTYSFGSSEEDLKNYAWSSGNSGSQIQNVAGLKPNPYGLYDMHGNGLEWVEDWYQSQLPGGKNPSGPRSGHYRTIRSSSWGYDARDLRSAHRGQGNPHLSGDYLGFRLVRTTR